MQSLVDHLRHLPTFLKDAQSELNQVHKLQRDNQRLRDKLKTHTNSPRTKHSLSPNAQDLEKRRRLSDIQKELATEKVKHKITIETAKEEIIVLQQENEQLKKEVDALIHVGTQIETKHNCSAGNSNKTDPLGTNKENDASIYECKSKQRQFERSKQILKELKKENADLKQLTQTYREEVEFLQEKLRTLETTDYENIHHKRRNDPSDDNATKLKYESEIEQWRQEVQDLKEAINYARIQNQDINEEHAKEMITLNEKLATLTEKKNDLKGELKKTRKTIEDKDQLIFELKDKIMKKRTGKLETTDRNKGDEAIIQMLTNDLKEAKLELDDTKTRLSKLMGQKLTDNNPNIADLSDKNRPTKLAERYTELYDNQWTDAFEAIDNGHEQTTIWHLNRILVDIMEFCRKESEDQLNTLKHTVVLENTKDGVSIPDTVVKQLKDCRKVLAEESGKHIFKRYMAELRRSRSPIAAVAGSIKEFIKECFDVCWLMSIQDPPVVLGPEIQEGDAFNTDVYKAYTSSGPRVEFVVWPALYLYQGGAILCKGVAQGYGTRKRSRSKKRL